MPAMENGDFDIYPEYTGTGSEDQRGKALDIFDKFFSYPIPALIYSYGINLLLKLFYYVFLPKNKLHLCMIAETCRKIT